MLLLQYAKKDVNEVWFVKYPSKYHNETNYSYFKYSALLIRTTVS